MEDTEAENSGKTAHWCILSFLYIQLHSSFISLPARLASVQAVDKGTALTLCARWEAGKEWGAQPKTVSEQGLRGELDPQGSPGPCRKSWHQSTWAPQTWASFQRLTGPRRRGMGRLRVPQPWGCDRLRKASSPTQCLDRELMASHCGSSSLQGQNTTPSRALRLLPAPPNQANASQQLNPSKQQRDRTDSQSAGWSERGRVNKD